MTDAGLRETIARLERRAARERTARLEAELIAENQFRRSYERSREVELLASIAVIVNESSDAISALGAAAKVIRRHCDFAVSHVLLPDDDGAFVTADVWDADPASLDFLDKVVSVTVDLRFLPPSDLPGEVAASHLALWLPDLSLASNYLRIDALAGGASWAFPVVTGVDVVAVIEFVHPTPRVADERLLQLAPSIATQLGRAFDWQRLRERQEVDRRQLEDLLAQRAAEVTALQRERREAGESRSAYLAYLAHEATKSMQLLQTAEGIPAAVVEDLNGLAAKLVVVADGTGRRILGDRSLVTPDGLLASVVSRYKDAPVPVSALPSGIDPAFVTSLHAPSVERVLVALVDNAIQHAGTDCVELSLELSSDELTIEVCDDGIGFTWDQNGARPSGEGGLAQAARLAHALGGDLQVTAEPRGGTVARVRLAARSGGPAAWTVRSTRVLLVDDNEINRRLAAAMLDRIGLTTDVVDGGRAALEAMRSTSYGLVFMDIQMPDLDGREVTREWRQTTDGATPADVPIVAVTAHVGQQERDLCREAGMVDYLSKPFGIEALSDRARRWMVRDHERSEAERAAAVQAEPR